MPKKSKNNDFVDYEPLDNEQPSMLQKLMVEPLDTKEQEEKKLRFSGIKKELDVPQRRREREEFSQNFQGRSIPVSKFLDLPSKTQIELYNTHEYNEDTQSMEPREE